MPHFYKEYGRVTVAGEVIGSVKRGSNNRSSSVVMAYWPGSGVSLSSINYGRMRVGVVQYFIRHHIKLYTVEDSDINNTEEVEHVFAFVYWKKRHPEESWFGISAIILYRFV